MVQLSAYLLMIINHVGHVWFPASLLCQAAGPVSWMLFCWGVAQGYQKTKDWERYLFRLAVLAVVSQIPYGLVYGFDRLNPIFALALGLCVLAVAEVSAITAAALLAGFFCLPVSFLMIAAVVAFGLLDEGGQDVFFPVFFAGLAVLAGWVQVAGLLAVVMVRVVPGRFRLPRRISYAIYPGHFLLIVLLVKLL